MSKSNNKIIRTPSLVGGGITAEEKLLLDEHAKLWIARIMRTEPIEPDKIVPAIERLYAAAGLKNPRVVIVPSPLVAAVACGFAAAIWWRRDAIDAATWEATRGVTYAATQNATWGATDIATREATWEATRAATHNATWEATDAATREAAWEATWEATRGVTNAATWEATDAATREAAWEATRDATYAATQEVTHNATLDATDVATREATWEATRAATQNATQNATWEATWEATDTATQNAMRDGWAFALAKEISGNDQSLLMLMLKCIKSWSNMCQGGNMWGQYDCYLTAVRDVLGLRLPEHAVYKFWEEASIHGGFRLMHDKFCLVSDFPEILSVDDQNRPHGENGPSHRWRDGWSLYHWHGVRVPAYVVESAHLISVAKIDAEENVEVRRVMIERFGNDRFLQESGAKVVHRDDWGTIYRRDFMDDEPMVMVNVVNSTPEADGSFKNYFLRVPPEFGDGSQTARAAVAWTFDVPEEDYAPTVES